MLALIGYIGAIPGRVWSVARQNPALKWALLALGVVLAVEVVAELGLKVWRDYSEAVKASGDAGAKVLEKCASTGTVIDSDDAAGWVAREKARRPECFPSGGASR